MSDTPDWLARAAWVESAVAFDLPTAIGDRIRGLRGASDARQLAPHLTLCFLGRLPGPIWARLAAAIRTLTLPPTVGAQLRGIGAFRDGAARIRNVHVPVVPTAELVALHESVLAVAADLPGFDPGPYCGSGWVPHVSVIDGEDLGTAIPAPLATPWDEAIDLVRPHLLARRVDPVRIVELG